jgi:hypothetical protein
MSTKIGKIQASIALESVLRRDHAANMMMVMQISRAAQINTKMHNSYRHLPQNPDVQNRRVVKTDLQSGMSSTSIPPREAMFEHYDKNPSLVLAFGRGRDAFTY